MQGSAKNFLLSWSFASLRCLHAAVVWPVKMHEKMERQRSKLTQLLVAKAADGSHMATNCWAFCFLQVDPPWLSIWRVVQELGSRIALPRYCTSIYKGSRAQLGQECNITKHQKRCNFPANWGWPSSAEVEDKPCLDHGGILACTKIACALWELAWNSAIVFRFVPGLYASIAGAVFATFAATSYELRLFLSVAGAICQADAASFCDTDGCFAKTGSSQVFVFFLERFESTTCPCALQFVSAFYIDRLLRRCVDILWIWHDMATVCYGYGLNFACLREPHN